jgi:hypothetical protein
MRETLVKMLLQLQEDMTTLHQLGAGYYSCIPFARRYNKLLGEAKRLFADEHGIIDTFDEAEESDPKDPGDKIKIVQALRIECMQLVTFLRATKEKGAAGTETDSPPASTEGAA